MKPILSIFILVLSLNLFSQDLIISENDLGILEAKVETYKEQIVIYNHDGTVWIQYDHNYEEKLSGQESYTFDDVKKLYKWNDNFKPYSFHIDYALLMFECKEFDGERYKVVVNKETGLEKYIKKSHFWILRDWEEHITKSVATVDFDTENNPLRTNPSNESEIVNINVEYHVIVPVEINGDWLKVRYWIDDSERIGWVKWKKDNKILLKLYYLI